MARVVCEREDTDADIRFNRAYVSSSAANAHEGVRRQDRVNRRSRSDRNAYTKIAVGPKQRAPRWRENISSVNAAPEIQRSECVATRCEVAIRCMIGNNATTPTLELAVRCVGPVVRVYFRDNCGRRRSCNGQRAVSKHIATERNRKFGSSDRKRKNIDRNCCLPARRIVAADFTCPEAIRHNSPLNLEAGQCEIRTGRERSRSQVDVRGGVA